MQELLVLMLPRLTPVNNIQRSPDWILSTPDQMSETQAHVLSRRLLKCSKSSSVLIQLEIYDLWLQLPRCFDNKQLSLLKSFSVGRVELHLRHPQSATDRFKLSRTRSQKCSMFRNEEYQTSHHQLPKTFFRLFLATPTDRNARQWSVLPPALEIHWFAFLQSDWLGTIVSTVFGMWWCGVCPNLIVPVLIHCLPQLSIP